MRQQLFCHSVNACIIDARVMRRARARGRPRHADIARSSGASGAAGLGAAECVAPWEPDTERGGCGAG